MTVTLCWRFDCFAFPFGVEVGGDFVFRSSPRVPSSEVDVSVYIPFFYFYIFYIQQPPFIPNHDGRLKWSAGTRFHPFLSSLNRVDRMKPNCGLLRFAGEVRLQAPGSGYLLDLTQPFKCLCCVVNAVWRLFYAPQLFLFHNSGE